MQIKYTSDLRKFQVVKILFPRSERGGHKIEKKHPCGTCFSIFDVKYFFNERTVA